MNDTGKRELKEKVTQAQCVNEWEYRKIQLEIQHAMLEEMRAITKQLDRIASNV